MWKAQVGHAISGSSSLAKKILAENENDPDDWDTDPDFVVILFLFSPALSKLDLYLIFFYMNRILFLKKSKDGDQKQSKVLAEWIQ